MQHLIFAFLALAAALATLLVSLYASRRGDPGVIPLVVCLGLASLSLITGLFELVAADNAWTLFWGQLKNLFIAGQPIAWVAFALQYAGHTRWSAPGRFWIFTIIPMLTLVLTVTNPQHGQVWSSFQVEREGGFLVVRAVYGSWFWLQWIYSIGMLATAAVLIARANDAGRRDRAFQTG